MTKESTESPRNSICSLSPGFGEPVPVAACNSTSRANEECVSAWSRMARCWKRCPKASSSTERSITSDFILTISRSRQFSGALLAVAVSQEASWKWPSPILTSAAGLAAAWPGSSRRCPPAHTAPPYSRNPKPRDSSSLQRHSPSYSLQSRQACHTQSTADSLWPPRPVAEGCQAEPPDHCRRYQGQPARPCLLQCSGHRDRGRSRAYP